jgi:hypothetical protein
MQVIKSDFYRELITLVGMLKIKREQKVKDREQKGYYHITGKRSWSCGLR